VDGFEIDRGAGIGGKVGKARELGLGGGAGARGPPGGVGNERLGCPIPTLEGYGFGGRVGREG
jgi:hypothetical protein